MDEAGPGGQLSRRRPAQWSWVKLAGSKELVEKSRRWAREKATGELGSRGKEAGRCGVCEGDTEGAEGGPRRPPGIGTGAESSHCCILADLPQMV